MFLKMNTRHQAHKPVIINKWLILRKNLVKSRNITEVQQPTRSSESVEKLMIAQIGCIDVAAVGMVKRVKLRQRAKFRGDRSNRCQDMAIFRFLEMAAAAILDS